MIKLAGSIFIPFFCAAVICFHIPAAVFAANEEIRYYTDAEIREFADGIVEWKCEMTGAESVEELINDKLTSNAGDQTADWYILGMARLYDNYDFSRYADALSIKIEEIKASADPASVTVTDLHRMALALTAAGGDPADLIAYSTYNRGFVAPLDKQGVTGPLWALITLDSMQQDVPEASYYSREEIIRMILDDEKDGGGFALAGPAADPDITAMAVQALAPYYNSTDPGFSVRDAVDRALTKLSQLQEETGDFSSWGNRNAQTGAQVMLALSCLDIDPQTDPRFIKNGNTLMDGLLLYRMQDKGFANTFPAERSNSKTSEQVLYTFTALLRQMSGRRHLYDMRPESGDEQSLISTDSSSLTSSADPGQDPETELKTNKKIIIIAVSSLLFILIITMVIVLLRKRRTIN